jgi:hypothetical protein
MIRAIVLNKEIKCENICAEIQKLVNRYNQENTPSPNAILVMEIKTIVDSREDTGPLRLEHKTEDV